MKKKLISILIAIILITGVSKAVTLTQRLGNEYITTTVDQGEIITMKFKSKPGFKFTKWTNEPGFN